MFAFQSVVRHRSAVKYFVTVKKKIQEQETELEVEFIEEEKTIH